MKRPEVKISIPDNLKVQLVDDWEAITKNQQVRNHFKRTLQARAHLETSAARAVAEGAERRSDPRRVAHLPAKRGGREEAVRSTNKAWH